MLSISFFCYIDYSTAQINQITKKIFVAEDAINQAFTAVLDAEKLGKNVTTLLNQLQLAADCLSKAKIAFRTGDFITATNLAESVISVASEVHVDAVAMKNEALTSSQNVITIRILFSLVGGLLFILFMFLAWKYIKRKYLKNLINKTPEVTTV